MSLTSRRGSALLGESIGTGTSKPLIWKAFLTVTRIVFTFCKCTGLDVPQRSSRAIRHSFGDVVSHVHTIVQLHCIPWTLFCLPQICSRNSHHVCSMHWWLEASDVLINTHAIHWPTTRFTKLTNPFWTCREREDLQQSSSLEPSYSPAILKSQQWSWWWKPRPRSLLKQL